MKGFIFTTDAFLSITIVILMLSLIGIYTTQDYDFTSELSEIKLLEKKMRTILFNDYEEPQAGNNIYCSKIIYYDFDDTNTLKYKKICSEIV